MFKLLSKTDFYSLRDSSQPFLVDSSSTDNKTIADFVHDIAIVYPHFSARRETVFLIFSENIYEFMVIFFTALLAKKKVCLLNTNKYAYIKDLFNDDTLFISDTSETQLSVSQLLCDAANTTHTDSIDCAILKGLTISPAADIHFYTSGSTGKPKVIEKKFSHLEREVEELFACFGEDITDSLFLTSVFHYHVYGFLFYVLLPFAVQCPIFSNRINYLETCAGFSSWKKITFVSSPAFLKRIVKIPLTPSTQWTVFSSAGALDAAGSSNCADIFGTEAIEIYGSTETGGIAWRKQKTNPLWRPFPCVSISAAPDNTFTARSPYFDGTVMGGDLIACTDEGLFTLLGRVDSTVKIEGRRIDLKDIDTKLLALSDCADCHTIYHKTNRREQTVSFIVLKKDTPLYTLYLEDEQAVKKHIQDYLYTYFDKTLAPRKIYILDAIPKNAMGKINHAQLESLLNRAAPYEYTAQPICFTDGHYSVKIDISFPETSFFFRGHFDGFPLVPAVAQVKTAFDISKKLFSHSLYIKTAKKLKYTNMIHPGIPLVLSLDFFPQGKKLSFSFSDADKTYSSGTLHLEGF
ncbi:long-chain fatty acid--CoA ligase [Treponema medium]|uniref:AMP-binding protein n=1 Tax=Treponema medium TaxID=58231 RepID=UPI00197FA89C|nr:class I adenylate-forming enzyme family protein [Treponema medium]QSH91727.1 long-chain fatty acid--CoA ligase [Treponema medium]